MHRASKSAAGDAGSMPRNGTAHALRPHSACNARRAIRRRLGGVDIVDDRRQDRRRRATPASTGRVGNHGAQRGMPLRAGDSPAWRMGAGWARMQLKCGLHADSVGAQALCRYPASRWMHREAVRHAPRPGWLALRMHGASNGTHRACTGYPSSSGTTETLRWSTRAPASSSSSRTKGTRVSRRRPWYRSRERPGARADGAEKPLFRAATSASKTSGRPLDSAARINQLRDTPCSTHSWSTRVS